MPSINNELKICTFNAECDNIDLSCCVSPNQSCGQYAVAPDSVVATMIAVSILPGKADVYNIQNVKNACVVKDLLREIERVRQIMSGLPSNFNTLYDMVPDGLVVATTNQLNALSGICGSATQYMDTMRSCNILCDLEYVNTCDTQDPSALYNNIMKYYGTSEYVAYYAGTCLTLIKKSLCIVPEIREVPSVDSVVCFFEYCNKHFINVNLNLGSISNCPETLAKNKSKVQNLVKFLKHYQDCGSLILTGPLGDIDYAMNQKLFVDDLVPVPPAILALLPNLSQPNTIPSDFPCNLDSPVYGILESMLRACDARSVPYSLLLQYIRLKRKHISVQCVEKPKSQPKQAVPQNNKSKHKKRSHVKRCEQPKNRYVVPVNVCKPSDCNSCSTDGCGEMPCNPSDTCSDYKYHDTLSVLERELSLYNVMNDTDNVSDRYTGYDDNFNKRLDCVFPRGMFQAWAECKKYQEPCKPSRVVDSLTERLALDHFLISDSLKNNVVCVSLSTLCEENNTIKSFFTNRVYCVNIDFPVYGQNKCDDSLHELGISALWQTLVRCGGSVLSVDTLIEVGFDRHPYFVKYFWSDCGMSLMNVQLRDSMTECEFNRHLLQQYKSTTREIFITTIAVMDAVYKTSNDTSLSQSDRTTFEQALLSTDIVSCVVENLLKYLAGCSDLATVIWGVLYGYLQENTRYMTVLCRHVVIALNLCGCSVSDFLVDGETITSLSNYLSSAYIPSTVVGDTDINASGQFDTIMQQLLFGESPRMIVENIIELLESGTYALQYYMLQCLLNIARTTVCDELS